MRKLSVLFQIILFGFIGSPTANAEQNSDTEQLERDFLKSSALLYGQEEDGSLKMLCTATAFERNGKSYRFVTAAHCISEDDTNHERVKVSQSGWFITFDDPDMKNFMAAKIVGVGYQHRGDDFAVLEVEFTGSVPVVPLANDPPHLGENVINVASPLGLGRQLFRGHVSMEKLDRPLVQDSINWKGAALLQMSVGPGSSGSAVVSVRQKGIVAFIVGEVTQRGSPNIVAIPVTKFKKFWAGIKEGKYKWYKPDASQEGAEGKKK